jgi:hypothetical protein
METLPTSEYRHELSQFLHSLETIPDHDVGNLLTAHLVFDGWQPMILYDLVK